MNFLNYERLLLEFFLTIAFMIGYYWTTFAAIFIGLWKSVWYRSQGWKRVPSPWPVWEKNYGKGIVHRAVNEAGMKAADKRYKETKSPEINLDSVKSNPK